MADGQARLEAVDSVRLGALTDSLGFLLRLAQLETFRTYFEALGDLRVRPGELTVLLLLAENPGVIQGHLARRLAIKRAHMTKLVKALEEQGLLSRQACDSDRRAISLRLTVTGAAQVQRLKARFSAHEAKPSGHLSAAESEQLKSLLRGFLGLAEAA